MPIDEYMRFCFGTISLMDYTDVIVIIELIYVSSLSLGNFFQSKHFGVS